MIASETTRIKICWRLSHNESISHFLNKYHFAMDEIITLFISCLMDYLSWSSRRLRMLDAFVYSPLLPAWENLKVWSLFRFLATVSESNLGKVYTIRFVKVCSSTMVIDLRQFIKIWGRLTAEKLGLCSPCLFLYRFLSLMFHAQSACGCK